MDTRHTEATAHKVLALMALIGLILQASPLAAQDGWRRDANGRQSISIEKSNEWGFETADQVIVNVHDQGGMRSEWVRWGSMASNRPTARVNYQKGTRFRYDGRIGDHLDEELKALDLEKSRTATSLNTKFGVVDAMQFKVHYRGYNRSCLYFYLDVPSNRRIFKGYFCDEINGLTQNERLQKLLDGIIVE